VPAAAVTRPCGVNSPARPTGLPSSSRYTTPSRSRSNTDWEKYGRGKDERCSNCMAHCGYEPTAVLATTSSLKESLRAMRG
jgi:hypothetical protein